MSHPLYLEGIDGSNPMGFMAALGVLVAGEPYWKLGWREDGLVPVLEGADSLDQVVEILETDRQRRAKNGLLALSELRDLKVPPEDFRKLAVSMLEQPRDSWPYGIWMLSVLSNEQAVDGAKGNTKPPVFDFTSGSQSFLSIVRDIHSAVTPEHLKDALSRPWQREVLMNTLRWDSAVFREYALRLKDPSPDNKTKTTEPGGEWLAFLGLSLLPSAPANRTLYTAGVEGSWKYASFAWPLWSAPASKQEVGALLTSPLPGADQLDDYMRARGIIRYFRSEIRRPKYGNFSPSRPL